MNKDEIINSALEAMKEQDNHTVQSIPKIIMSIETYKQMQRDSKFAEDVCSRMRTNDERSNELSDFIKKW